VEREAHGIQQGILRWGGPLLEKERACRGGDQVTEHKAQPREEQAEERPGQSLPHKKRQAQEQRDQHQRHRPDP
jgi:hypothetical protein